MLMAREQEGGISRPRPAETWHSFNACGNLFKCFIVVSLYFSERGSSCGLSWIVFGLAVGCSSTRPLVTNMEQMSRLEVLTTEDT